MGKFVDLTGQKFGRWTVIERDFSKLSTRVYWKCQCECGTIKSVLSQGLKNGTSKSCGCWNKERDRNYARPGKIVDMKNKVINNIKVLEQDNETYENRAIHWKCECLLCGNIFIVDGRKLRGKDAIRSCGCLKHKPKELLGQRFGNLLVIRDTKKRNNDNCRNRIWECKCDCGNLTYKTTKQLTEKYNLSCGCINNRIMSNYIDITNEKFGKLIAIEPTNQRSGSHIVWKCKCDCGNIHYCSSNSLLGDKCHSCGCLKSQGEAKISKILTENNISFIKQKTFETCRFPDTQALAKFDFYVDNKYLIELDGIQHFEATSGWNTEEQVYKTQQRDQFKNQWCKENNIPLIRIPYTQLKTLTIEDLLCHEDR